MKIKKRNQLIVLIALSMLFSCNNGKKTETNNELKSSSEMKPQVRATEVEKLDSISNTEKKSNVRLSDVSYFFSNDTLCQNITLSEITRNDKFNIPQKLGFKIVLSDKQGKSPDKVFNGIAKLSSSEESFGDSSEADGGDYFAGDYILETADFEVQIRLDIENYEACVISLIPKNDTVLGVYSSYLKKFPSEGVMKKGKCK